MQSKDVTSAQMTLGKIGSRSGTKQSWVGDGQLPRKFSEGHSPAAYFSIKTLVLPKAYRKVVSGMFRVRLALITFTLRQFLKSETNVMKLAKILMLGTRA